MKDWCLKHPIMTFLLIALLLGTIASCFGKSTNCPLIGICVNTCEEKP